jgi:hypothetical protein
MPGGPVNSAVRLVSGGLKNIFYDQHPGLVLTLHTASYCTENEGTPALPNECEFTAALAAQQYRGLNAVSGARLLPRRQLTKKSLWQSKFTPFAYEVFYSPELKSHVTQSAVKGSYFQQPLH